MGASDRALLFAALATAGTIGIATAQNNELDIGLHAFQDSRGVTVLSPDIAFDRDFTDRTSLRLKAGVDAISAASDSCARCHPEGAFNSRVVGGLSLTRRLGDTRVTVGGEFSTENFYTATTVLTSISRNLNKGNTTVAGGFSYSLNQPLLHPSETVEKQHSFDAFGSITQSWTKTTVTQFGYEVNQINGYQTNPFLRAQLNGQMTLGQAPDARTRQTLTARLRQALPGQTVLEADFRRYFDSWSIDSNTFSLGLSHHFSDRFVGGGEFRWYDQTAAFFYAPTYTGSPRYFTGDFRLFPFTSDTFTGHVTITPPNGFWYLPRGAALNLQYERYRATTGFEAGVFTAGLRIPLK